MSEPIRLTCTVDRDLPSADEIAGQITADRHLVLIFPTAPPTRIDKQTIIDLLSNALPNYSVFDSGGAEGTTWITVMQVVPTASVDAHATQIIAAAHMFRVIATDLMTRLARKLGAPLEAFTADPLFGRQYSQSGKLDAGWRYGFHGFECSFTNTTIGKRLEVRRGFAEGFGCSTHTSSASS